MSDCEMEKRILKAESAEEVNEILSRADAQQLRNVIKLLMARINMLCLVGMLEVAHERDEDE